MLAARADERPGKVDLGVGIYKDENGATPIMAAVKTAERRLLETEKTKAYEGPRGNPVYCDELARLIFGSVPDHLSSFATPGGCGALFIGMQLARQISPDARLFLSDPSWPNHRGIASALGIETVFYPYRSTQDGTPDFELVMKGLKGARRGDVLLLQGACHNPTGTDFSAEQWQALAEHCNQHGLIPFVDTAYQGFASGVEEDGAAAARFLRQVPEAIMTYSCSKNFGLYRERTGALFVQAATATTQEAVTSQASALIRASYSMPPAHGPAIVETILTDDALKAEWLEELGGMRERLIRLREGFADALVRASNREEFRRVANEHGMFSQLPIAPDGAEKLRQEKGVYLPGTGRINIAGLPDNRLDDLAADLAPYLAV
jgi:aspartate aminotransferase/aromatic-amino-acid transaminase